MEGQERKNQWFNKKTSCRAYSYSLSLVSEPECSLRDIFICQFIFSKGNFLCLPSSKHLCSSEDRSNFWQFRERITIDVLLYLMRIDTDEFLTYLLARY